MKASELFDEDPWLKVLVYGSSGSGKTTWAAVAPRPLILLTERQGLPSIIRANPDAEVEIVNDYDRFCDVLLAVVRGHKVTINAGESQQSAFEVEIDGRSIVIQSVVLDSLSDLHERARKSHDYGEDGIDWMGVQEDVRAFLDDLRNLPVNLVTLALADESIDEHNRRRTTPLLYGKIGKLIGQWHSAVGFSHKRELDGEIQHGIAWQLGRAFDSKPAPGFPLYTRSNVLEQPGDVSLGSLLLHAFDGYSVSCEECDEAAFVTRQIEHEATRRAAKKTTTTTRRAGRTGRRS